MNNRNRLYFLGAYWPARKETAGDCARRLLTLFRALREQGDGLDAWFELGDTRQKALERRVSVLDREHWLEILARSRNMADRPRRPIDELGFSIGLWNGADDDHAVGIQVRCGSYNQHVSNCVTINFPAVSDRLVTLEPMRAVLTAVAESFEPRWAGVMSRAAMDARDFSGRRPFVDWMVYICRDWLPSPPTLDPPASVHTLDTGTLIVVQDEPPNPASADDLANIRRVEESLDLKARW